MFRIDQDKTMHLTRGDIAGINITAKNNDGTNHTFVEGDVVRLKVFEKKDCNGVVLQKDVAVTEETTNVEIALDSKDTKIGDLINKPKDYWYEVELNPNTAPQTIIGYDDVTGAKVFRLYPEGSDLNE
jgi:hypothetical protein